MRSTSLAPPAVTPSAVADALAVVAPRAAALIDGMHDGARPAIGLWSAIETAVHLVNAVEIDRAVARGDVAPPVREQLDNVTLGTLDGLTQRLVRDEPERRPAALADRIRAGCDDLVARLRHAHEDIVVPWIGPVELPLSAVGAHAVEELLVHGLDIARSQGVRWPLDPAHVRLAVAGFVVPMLSAVDPNEFVNAERAKGFSAVFDMRIRGVARRYFVFDDGRLRVEPAWEGRVDAVLSAEPGAFLLVQLGRLGRVRPALTGRMLAWGRRPWRLARFVQLMGSV